MSTSANDQMGDFSDSYNEFFNRMIGGGDGDESRNSIYPFGVNTANDYNNNFVDRGEITTTNDHGMTNNGEIIVEGNAIYDYYNDGFGPIHEPLPEPMRQLRHQPIHEPIHQFRYQFAHLPIHEPIHEPLHQPIHGLEFEPDNIVRRLEFDSDDGDDGDDGVDDGDDDGVGNEQPIISRMVPISLDELCTLTIHASDEVNMRESCPICLEHYGTNSDDRINSDVGNICKLNCAHYFHISCLSQWLTRHHTCPSCRSKI